MLIPNPSSPSPSDSTTSSTAAMLHKANLIQQTLIKVYPTPPSGFLHHTNPFTLLIAVLLSAQSLDSKVNQVTPQLFQLADTPQKMRTLGEDKIRSLIKQIGLAPQKAKNINKLSHTICDQFDGNVPDTFEGLESLAGVGHKTASVVMMQAFGKPAFPVDTHIHRLACRWGCGDPKSVEKTEAALKQWFPDPTSWGDLHVRMILFGREHCPARKHDMDKCPVCSFAATDESRRANDIHSNKFVAAVRHRNPYSVREVDEVKIQQAGRKGVEDDDYVPKNGGKRKGKRATQTRRRGVQLKENDLVNEGRAVGTGKGTGSDPVEDMAGEDQSDTAPTRRSARLGKKQGMDLRTQVETAETNVKKRSRLSRSSQHTEENSGNMNQNDVNHGGKRRKTRSTPRKEVDVK